MKRIRGLADADILTALAKRSDHLKQRARRHAEAGGLIAPFSVGIELLFVAEKHGISKRDFIGAATHHVPLEDEHIILTAAEALDEGDIGTVFDAVHAATALHRNIPLHTTDRALQRSSFPTIALP